MPIAASPRRREATDRLDSLTGADTVIFYDADYNVAMDRQAMDRAHRIGQTREGGYLAAFSMSVMLIQGLHSQHLSSGHIACE